jgi:hypothetical protein
LEDLGVDGSIIFEWNFEKQDGKVWTGFAWVGMETGGEIL